MPARTRVTYQHDAVAVTCSDDTGTWRLWCEDGVWHGTYTARGARKAHLHVGNISAAAGLWAAFAGTRY